MISLVRHSRLLSLSGICGNEPRCVNHMFSVISLLWVFSKQKNSSNVVCSNVGVVPFCVFWLFCAIKISGKGKRVFRQICTRLQEVVESFLPTWQLHSVWILVSSPATLRKAVKSKRFLRLTQTRNLWHPCWQTQSQFTSGPEIRNHLSVHAI